MKSEKWWRKILFMFTLSVVLFNLASCGFSTESPVIFLDFSWESVQVHNRIAAYIIEKGFGRSVIYTFAEVVPGLMGLERGDVHIAMETWVDNAGEFWKKAEKRGKLRFLGKNFPDAPQGWYVPTYLIKGDPNRGIKPMAPDLKSVKDLSRYWELFRDPENPQKGRFYNGPTGWNVSVTNEKKMKSYGLNSRYTVFYCGSASALATAIASAYEKGKPVLAYYWEPTPILGMYDMTKLEEPPYDEKVWNTSGGCDFPASRVLKTINTVFAEENPEIENFLIKYETTMGETNTFLAYMKRESASSFEAAVWFLKHYSERWHQWLDDPLVIKNVEDALKNEKI